MKAGMNSRGICRFLMIFACAVWIGAWTGLAAADEIDLVTNDNAYHNGAFFSTSDIQATGSGVIDPFVRISSNNPVESGYNTSFRPLEFDENSSPTFTHDLPLSIVPIVTIGGIDYREFLLDINQTKSGDGRFLSLDEIEIYLSNTAGNTGYQGGLGTQVYFFEDAAAGSSAPPPNDHWIKLDYSKNAGSGSGDLFVYIPNSFFGGGYTYVYFYSLFGEHYANNDGYEEWAVRTTTPLLIPEPGTLVLLGSGLVGLAGYGRKKFKRQ